MLRGNSLISYSKFRLTTSWSNPHTMGFADEPASAVAETLLAIGR